MRRLHTRPNTDVYIIGSNSQLLSGDLATDLAGRYAEIPVFPLSFEEYAHYRNASESRTTIAQGFADYMRYGGMPGLYKQEMPSLDTVREQLDGIYDSVVVKDVAERNNIRDLGMLNTVCKYLFFYIRHPFLHTKCIKYAYKRRNPCQCQDSRHLYTSSRTCIHRLSSRTSGH